jgi:hypothetical protein
LVARVRAIRTRIGVWLAHAAPRERIQLLTADHDARAARMQERRKNIGPGPHRSNKRRRSNLAQDRPHSAPTMVEPVSKRTRLSVGGPVMALYAQLQRRARLGDIYEWDFHSGPIQSYLTFQSTRWKLVQAVANDWRIHLPRAGFCHIHASELRQTPLVGRRPSRRRLTASRRT